MTRRFSRTIGRPVGPSCRGLPVLIWPPLALRAGAPDRDAFLMLPDTRDQQRRLEELVHDVVRLPETVVHERGIPRARLDEERRRLGDPRRLGHLDVHVGAIVEGTHWLPRHVVAFDLVVEVEGLGSEARKARDGRALILLALHGVGPEDAVRLLYKVLGVVELHTTDVRGVRPRDQSE